MARLDPRPDDQLGDLEDMLAVGEKRLGFRPNSHKTMAWRPEIFRAYQGLAQAVFAPGTVPTPVKQMVATMVSYAAGCRYCQAHTGSVSTRAGVTEQKLTVLWDFESSPMFSDAERVALRIALAAGQVPNAVTDAQFAALKEHYTPEQIVELISVISLMGFLNRWNDTLATDLEEIPMAFGNAVLAQNGWTAGKHGPVEAVEPAGEAVPEPVPTEPDIAEAVLEAPAFQPPDQIATDRPAESEPAEPEAPVVSEPAAATDAGSVAAGQPETAQQGFDVPAGPEADVAAGPGTEEVRSEPKSQTADRAEDEPAADSDDEPRRDPQ
jgi:alkylhydroperoxidase family enzyme